MPDQLRTENLTLSYHGGGPVVRQVTLQVQTGAVTSIIGPNGCGKSTLLRAMARLLKPSRGTVLLDGEIIHRLPTREVARRLSLLAQQAQPPAAITVEELARRGRYPHQAFFQSPTRSDEEAVNRALELVGMSALRSQPVDDLSGGQRQRAWLAMALAQETPVLLLDEPTTYLDIGHQQEILALVRRLNREEGRSIVLVLHDINDALQVSDQVILMQDGRIRAEGAPGDVVTPELLESVFGLACQVMDDPEMAHPLLIPASKVHLSSRSNSRAGPPALRAEALTTGYDGRRVLEEVSVSLPTGRVTAIVGPNASGKSTLLRSFARLLPIQDGLAVLDGQPVAKGSHRKFAQRLAVQLQGAIPPEGVLVEDLVAVGRHPYQCWYRQWTPEDQRVIDRALEVVKIEEFRSRPVDTLSGGQQQRVWLAMALAQQTPVLLLDEPTTFLDIAHQVEVLDFVWQLNRSEGRTVGLVLHDLGMACRYADHLIVMKDGRVAAEGPPEQVVSEGLVRQVFGVESKVVIDRATGKPLVIPLRSGDSSQLQRRLPLAASPRPSPAFTQTFTGDLL